MVDHDIVDVHALPRLVLSRLVALSHAQDRMEAQLEEVEVVVRGINGGVQRIAESVNYGVLHRETARNTNNSVSFGTSGSQGKYRPSSSVAMEQSTMGSIEASSVILGLPPTLNDEISFDHHMHPHPLASPRPTFAAGDEELHITGESSGCRDEESVSKPVCITGTTVSQDAIRRDPSDNRLSLGSVASTYAAQVPYQSRFSKLPEAQRPGDVLGDIQSMDSNMDSETNNAEGSEEYFSSDDDSSDDGGTHLLTESLSASYHGATSLPMPEPPVQRKFALLLEWKRIRRVMEGLKSEEVSSEGELSTHLPRHGGGDVLLSRQNQMDFSASGIELLMLGRQLSMPRYKCPFTLPVLETEKFMVNPLSMKRTAWDIFGMGLIAYDVVVIPLQVFEMRDVAFTVFMNHFCMIFWTMDIISAFLTGVHDPRRNRIEMKPNVIARSYVKTWFLFDLLAVVPDWIALAVPMEDSEQMSGLGRTVRALRILRSLRLLRLAKLQRLVRNFEKRFNNEYITCYMNLGKLMLCIAVLNHFIGCAWYGVSRLSGSKGWVEVEGLADTDPEYRYLTSLHWSLTQFQGSMDVQPSTTHERAFAVIVLYCGLIICAAFISSITNFMTQIQTIHAETMQRRWMLIRYLHDNNISTELSLRVKQFVQEAVKKQQADDKDVELLQILPEGLRLDLDYEIKGPCLDLHPLLAELVRDDVLWARRIARVLGKQKLTSKEVLFHRGDRAAHMYLVVAGRLLYGYSFRNNSRDVPKYKQIMSRASTIISLRTRPSLSQRSQNPNLARISADSNGNLTFPEGMQENGQEGLGTDVTVLETGSTICEMALFTSWWHRGECVSQGFSEVMTLKPSDLEHVVTQDAIKATIVLRYARRFVAWINQRDLTTLDDICKPVQLRVL